MKSKEMICIVCPLGCKLTVKEETTSNKTFKVSGNKCIRGQEYGVKEMTNPTRVLTTTMKIDNTHLNRLPVRTKDAIPKSQIFQIMEAINKVEVTAPVTVGQVIMKDVLNTGVDIIASRSMSA